MKNFIEHVRKITKSAKSSTPIKEELTDIGRLVDEDLELIPVNNAMGNPRRGDVQTYQFKMVITGNGEEIGRIDLRLGNTEWIEMYLGHIGYRVATKYRGNRYAARATRLLLPLARKNGFDTLWITCNPDNIASRRTCELAGGELIEIVDVPKNSDFYRAGEKQKCRYRINL